MEFSVDRENGVIRGAKVLGPVSRNKRRYTAQARRDVARLAEGKPVRMKHGNDAYADTVGKLTNLREEGDSVFGDVHVKPHHPLREQMLWDAENSPREFGLSIDGDGRTGRKDRDGWVDVREVTDIKYVALVTDPATTTSIRESCEEPEMDLQTLKSDHADLVAQLHEEFRAEAAADETEKQERARLIQERDQARAELKESLDKLAAYEQVEQRRERREAILAEASELKAGDISEELMESYLDLKPETVTAFLKELAKRPLKESKEPEAKATPKSSDGVQAKSKVVVRRWWIPAE